MPLVSKAQARFLFSQKPELAKEFASKTESIRALPEKKPDKLKAAKERLVN